ncbi:MAG: S6e family ribosomal protein [Candidatus Micrarchaeaceae archaeon]
MKLVYSDKNGKSTQIELDEASRSRLLGVRIGEVIEGESVGVPGHKLKITGGSDTSGFPMVAGIEGSRKLGLLKTIKSSSKKGERKRQTVVGEAVSANTAQVNAVIIEEAEVGEKHGESTGPATKKE